MQPYDNELAGLEGNGVIGYGNRGMTFESLVEFANRQCRQNGEAIVEKQHTLCKPLRNAQGKIVSAKYEEKATVDFVGRIGDRPIAFEAKHCATDKIDLKRVESHQCLFLQNWTEAEKAIGFVIISFCLQKFYIIPWQYWQAAKEAREHKSKDAVKYSPIDTTWQLTGKASIKRDELPPEWEVKTGGKYGLDWIGTVKRLWKLDGGGEQ